LLSENCQSLTRSLPSRPSPPLGITQRADPFMVLQAALVAREDEVTALRRRLAQSTAAATEAAERAAALARDHALAEVVRYRGWRRESGREWERGEGV